MDKKLRIAYGEALVKLGKVNEKVVVCDADTAEATMTHFFRSAFPDRHFEFGIAEQNMVCAATGMANEGLIPFVSTFAIFGAGRAYEQVRNAVAYMNSNVKIACTHPGISAGEDGGTHQSVEDIALMRVVPNMVVLCPCDCVETEKIVFAAAEHKGPMYLRISRQESPDITDPDKPFVIGKADVIRPGKDVCIIAVGLMVNIALEAAAVLEEKGISVEVANMSSIKPIDREYILKANSSFKAILTAEEHSIYGGLGSSVAEIIAGKAGAKFDILGVEDKFGRSGEPSEIFRAYGLTKERIVEKCLNMLQKSD